MKYFLKGSKEKVYTQVTKEEYIRAERNAGFHPKSGNGIATGGFGNESISGKVDHEFEKRVIMNVSEFGDKINEIRARNGWRLVIEVCGVWIITVYDKETGEQIASSGSTGLMGILKLLETPFDSPLWGRDVLKES